MLITSNFFVNGITFERWFANFQTINNTVFEHPLQAEGFQKIMSRINDLTGKPALTLNEFVGHFCVIYNETGGTFVPITERGTAKYFFEKKTPKGTKLSYNQSPNRSAGNQLKEKGFIYRQADVEVWNSFVYPSNQSTSVYQAAKDCDFYKFRGRGLNQITWLSGYQKYVDPLLDGKKSEDLKDDELTAAFQNPHIYCGVFRNFISDPTWAGQAMEPLKQGNFLPYAECIAGKKAFIYHQKFVNRCQTMKAALQAKAIV
jgi:hypothetical protein